MSAISTLLPPAPVTVQPTVVPAAPLPAEQATTPTHAPSVFGSLARGTIAALFPPKRAPTTQMLDLRAMLTPEQQKLVDPMVFDFYQNPTAFVLHAGVDMTFLGKGLLPVIGLLAKEGEIKDKKPGFENYPMKQELTRDDAGHTYWKRMVKSGGSWNTLFDARFERAGDYVRETFRRGPLEIPLTFKVEPYQGGIRLTLVPALSSPLAKGEQIIFTTVPRAGGLLTTGHLATQLLGPMGDISIKIAKPEAAQVA